ncbi:unnamed protein product, partial [Didymodactylos carnosus]
MVSLAFMGHSDQKLFNACSLGGTIYTLVGTPFYLSLCTAADTFLPQTF